MTAPPVAQVDTASANDNAIQSFQYGEAENGVIHRSFKRVFEHYVENNMNATGYVETIGGTNVNNWQLDEGWHTIPYANPGVSMTAGDLAQMGAIGQGIRIDKLGFRITQAQMFRTDITAITGVTELSNTFLDNPWWETYADSLHLFDGMVLDSAAASPSTMSPGYVPLYSNNNMKAQEVTTFQQGLLPRIKWGWSTLPSAPGSRMVEDTRARWKGTADGPFEVISTLNNSSRSAKATQAMVGHGATWINKDKDAWYPFQLPNDISQWGTVKGWNAAVPATFPLNRPNLMNGTGGFDPQGGANNRGTNIPNYKHNRWAKMDLDTLTPMGMQDNPVDHYIKIQRMHDIASPMRLAGRIVIEYTCDVSIQPNEQLYMGTNSLTAGVTTTSYQDVSTNNQMTWGNLRRWRSWGIPSVPAFSTTDGGLQGTIRFPPWVTIDWEVFNVGTGPIPQPEFTAGFVSDWPFFDNPNDLFYRPDLELGTILYHTPDGYVIHSVDPLFYLVQSWDGDPPDAAGEFIDAVTVNGFRRPALVSYETTSGIPEFVWAMEMVNYQTTAVEGQNDRQIGHNVVFDSLGAPSPAINVVHLFADPVGPLTEDVENARKKRRIERLTDL